MSISLDAFGRQRRSGTWNVRDGQHIWRLRRQNERNGFTKITHYDDDQHVLLSFMVQNRHDYISIVNVTIPGLVSRFPADEFHPENHRSILELMLLEKLATVLNARVIELFDDRRTVLHGHEEPTTIMEYITKPNELSFLEKFGYREDTSPGAMERLQGARRSLAHKTIKEFIAVTQAHDIVRVDFSPLKRVHNDTLQEVMLKQDDPEAIHLLIYILKYGYFPHYRGLQKYRYDPASERRDPGFF